MKFSTPDFMHCSRRTLMLFVLSANVVGWIVIIALIWAGCEVAQWALEYLRSSGGLA
ncbi:hypothetical protein QCW82_004479 [Klebsiella michiganensis]|uniref:hypothetical protein n=1 Tax=Klebsiella michiganensis TaxID=1134687 RepID=UPI00197D2901|nr:hypothetical protein [Klebsiella michiganensis]EKV4192806.1 hypothetical protein [Klebsiella michiganensis]MBN4044234.1 hypothetical protein [Klebsiella michiganensis]HBV8114948.1 hypothetical protein [Klebsiella oxytoca]